MSEAIDKTSPRKRTGAIRLLDAGRARELVREFDRPAAAGDHATGGGGIADDRNDPIAKTSCGWVTLERLPDEESPATVVARYQTHLYLDGLERLPLSVARQLIRHRGHLYLDKLSEMTDTVAVELAKHAGGGLSLNNLKQLTPRAARALGRHDGELSLNGLRRLDAQAALGLARHANELYLDGLVSLSPACAAVLSRHRGDLSFDSLARISGRVATHLARHGGKLHLHGLDVLSDRAAEAFGQRTGFLCLRDVSVLSPRQAEQLAHHSGPLHLYSLFVDDAVAACLGRHEGSLSIRLADDVPLHRLAALAQHRGPLSISGLQTLDERRAAVLAARPAHRGIAGLSGLFISTVTQVTPAVAEILATYRAGELAFSGLTVLTEDVARILVRHPLLALDRLETISDRVATILAAYDGASLSLLSLKHVSPRALATLRANLAIALPPHLRSR